MLTQSHYAAQRLVRCSDKPIYRKHMCGLCHALGDGYGMASRLLTNHDTILLNLLSSAQDENEPDTIMRRCPLNPTRFVRTNQDAGSDFAAAVTVGLATVSVDDDITDSNGRNLIARLTRLMLRQPEHTAFRQLESLGFDKSTIQQLGVRQSKAEADDNANPAAPSAAMGAALFTMTAQLANLPQNAPALATAGTHYGTYIYLADAYRDFDRDMKRGDFNPLRPYAEMVNGAMQLSEVGKAWLVEQLEAILEQIQTALQEIILYRDRGTVKYLLTAPVKDLLGTLTGQPIGKTCGVCATRYDEKKRKGTQNNITKDKKRSDNCCCDGCYCVDCGDCCNCCDVDCCSRDKDGCDCDGDCCCPCRD